MNVIGFAGLPGSGKSTAIDAVRDLGTVVTMGDVVRLEAIKRKIDPTSQNLGKIAREIRKKEGEAVIALKCVELILEKPQEFVFIDGLRSLEEVKVFRSYWEFPIIAIVLDSKIRFKRLKERRRSDDPLTYSQFLERERRETKFGIENVINHSDYIVENDSDAESLEKEVRRIVLEIIGKA